MMLFPFKNKVLKVIDGDSLKVQLDHGCRITSIQRIRLERVDTPELNSKDPEERGRAEKAKQFIEDFFSQYGPTVEIRTSGEDPYGRYVADVILRHGPVVINLSDELLKSGHAKPYGGKV